MFHYGTALGKDRKHATQFWRECLNISKYYANSISLPADVVVPSLTACKTRIAFELAVSQHKAIHFIGGQGIDTQ
jgi:hypothetical protein